MVTIRSPPSTGRTGRGGWIGKRRMLAPIGRGVPSPYAAQMYVELPYAIMCCLVNRRRWQALDGRCDCSAPQPSRVSPMGGQEPGRPRDFVRPAARRWSRRDDAALPCGRMGTAWHGAGGQLVVQHVLQGEFPAPGRVLGNPHQVWRQAFRTDLIVGSAIFPDRIPGDGPGRLCRPAALLVPSGRNGRA